MGIRILNGLVEVIPDPEFNDDTAWSFSGTGATVADGKLTFVNSNILSSDTIPPVAAVPGANYYYNFIVSEYPYLSPITARILFGGMEIYNKNGTGTFSGIITATSTSGLKFLANLTGRFVVDRISINRTTL